MAIAFWASSEIIARFDSSAVCSAPTDAKTSGWERPMSRASLPPIETPLMPVRSRFGVERVSERARGRSLSSRKRVKPRAASSEAAASCGT